MGDTGSLILGVVVSIIMFTLLIWLIVFLDKSSKEASEKERKKLSYESRKCPNCGSNLVILKNIEIKQSEKQVIVIPPIPPDPKTPLPLMKPKDNRAIVTDYEHFFICKNCKFEWSRLFKWNLQSYF